MGGKGTELLGGMGVDSAGNVYISCSTDSTDMPVTQGVIQGYNRGGYFGIDAYIAKLDSTGGNLLYGTYLGGNDDDVASALAVDPNGNAYVAGFTSSNNFPVSLGAFQKNNKFVNAFISKIEPTGSRLVYSTYVGGSRADVPADIAIDAAGNAYVVGHTTSTDFPVTTGAWQTIHRGGTTDKYDGLVFKLNPQGSQLVYATFLGGSGEDLATAVAVDATGNAYVAGYTESSNFPISAGAFQKTLTGPDDAFLVKINPAGSGAVFATLLGGSRSDHATSVAQDATGIYVAGTTTSSNFPTLAPLQPSLNGTSDGFVLKLDPTGSKLVQATWLGGADDDMVSRIALDANGDLYVVGGTMSTDFPTTKGAPQTRYGGGNADAYLSRLSFAQAAITLSVSPDKMTFQGATGSILPHQSLAISTTGAAVAWSAAVSGGTWLNLNPKSGAGAANIDVSVDSTGMAAGSYNVTVSVTNQATGAVIQVPVALTLTKAADPGGKVPQSGVVNAATFLAGPVAPGEIITIFGSAIGPAALQGSSVESGNKLSTSIGQTRVLFDGVAAPMLYASASQVGAIVPYGLSGKAATLLEVEYGGVKSNALALQVASCSPGIFTANSSGKGQASVANQDGTYNSKDNPAAKNSVITFYATGEGQTDPAGTDGLLAMNAYPKPVLPVGVKIGNLPAEILYYGAAPQAVAGVFQVNVRIPETVPSGEQPLVVLVGNCVSPSGVTVALQ
jgi:uncharacterized protein (TIGR03437 family)